MLKSFAWLGRWPWTHPRLSLLLLLALGAAGVGGGVWSWRARQLPAAERAMGEGDFAQARQRLNRLLSWSPDDAAVLCLAARLERVEGRYDAAAAHLEQCQSRHGLTPLCALEFSLLRAQRGDLSEERNLLHRADADRAQSPWILEALARAHLNACHYPFAARIIEAWLKIQPDCVRALELHGRIFESSRAVLRAIATYERVLQLDPGCGRVRVRLTGILLELERLDQAATHLDILARDHSGLPGACVALGQRDVLQNRLEQARRRFQAALREDPKHVPAMLELGKLELQLDRADAAEGLLSRAHAAFPFDSKIHHALAECYQRLPGKQAKAEYHRQRCEAIRQHSREIDDILDKRLPESPKDPVVLAELGQLYLAVGQERRGEHWLLNALAINRDYAPAHASLADYYARAGEEGKAVYHRSRANQTRPRDGKAPAVSPVP